MAIGSQQQIVSTGLTPVYGTAAASQTITADDGLFLHVKNSAAENTVVTITDPGYTPAGSAATNPTITVLSTSGDKMIPLSKAFASASTGLITVGFSYLTSVTAALLRL